MFFWYSFFMRNREKETKQFFVALLLLLLGFVSSRFTSYMIDMYYPSRASAVDLIHEFLPYIQSLEIVADIGVLVAFFLLISYIRKSPEQIYKIMASFGVMYCVRAILNIATPLGKPLGNEISHGILKKYFHQAGMFPSGHTAFVFIVFFVIPPKYKTLRTLALLNGLIEVISMDLSWGHWTIDIAGGIMLAYCVYRFVENYGEWFLRENVQLSIDQ